MDSKGKAFGRRPQTSKYPVTLVLSLGALGKGELPPKAARGKPLQEGVSLSNIMYLKRHHFYGAAPCGLSPQSIRDYAVG